MSAIQDNSIKPRVLEMKESGMAWVQKRKFAFGFVTFVIVLIAVIMVVFIVNPTESDNSINIIGSVIVMLFFLSISWIPVMFRNANGAILKLKWDSERLVIEKDDEELMNTEWSKIESMKAPNGPNAMIVFTYYDENGDLQKLNLRTAYIYTDDIQEMLKIFKENWLDKYHHPQ